MSGEATRTTRLVIDCDPGQDDAIALMMALGTSELASTLAFVSTVAGNSPGDVTHRNARRVLDRVAPSTVDELPVHRGADTSLTYRVRPYFEGRDELPGWTNEAPLLARPMGRAVDEIVSVAEKNARRSLTICALGPLTNVALAILTDPRFVDSAASIVWMGGSVGRGNITPAAEFNAFADPEALAVVLASGIDLTVVPAEIGETARVDDSAVAAIADLGTPAGDAAAGLLRSMGNGGDHDRYRRLGRPMYDPTAVAVLARPGMFEVEPTTLVVDTNPDGPSYGATHFDLDNRTDEPANCSIARSVDTEAFVEYTIESLALAGTTM